MIYDNNNTTNDGAVNEIYNVIVPPRPNNNITNTMNPDNTNLWITLGVIIVIGIIIAIIIAAAKDRDDDDNNRNKR